MSFSALLPQPPIFPEEAAAYANATLARSEAALLQCDAQLDLHYGNDVWQTVDVYRARNAPSDGAPALVFAHGGAWTNGYKEWMGLMAPALTQAGIALVSVSYRLAPKHKWRDMLDDCLDAIGWVHAHARKHGIEPQRLGLGGHSAGGHLMALAALRPQLLARKGVPLASIVAHLPLCAPLDIRYPHRPSGSGEERTHQVLLDDSSEAVQASPICHACSDAPFTLLAYADDDLPRIVNGNREMAQALERVGAAHQTMVLPGDHFSVALDVADPASPWTRRVTELLLA